MKTKNIEIDGKSFDVRELTLEEGMPLISSATGTMDIAGLIRAATRINGAPAQPGEITMSEGMKLMPLVMELNSFAGGDSGNA